MTAALALILLALLPREPAAPRIDPDAFALEFRRIDGVWCRHDFDAAAGDAAATVCLPPQLADGSR